MQEKTITEMCKVIPESSRTLILENDNWLLDSVKSFEDFLIDHKRRYNVLFSLSNLEIQYIAEQINSFDIIVFQTSWRTAISSEIEGLLYSYEFISPKTIIEVSYSEPTWYYLPEGMAMDHQIWVLQDHAQPYKSGNDKWEFKKLRCDKATYEE